MIEEELPNENRQEAAAQFIEPEDMTAGNKRHATAEPLTRAAASAHVSPTKTEGESAQISTNALSRATSTLRSRKTPLSQFR